MRVARVVLPEKVSHHSRGEAEDGIEDPVSFNVKRKRKRLASNLGVTGWSVNSDSPSNQIRWHCDDARVRDMVGRSCTVGCLEKQAMVGVFDVFVSYGLRGP